MAQLTFLGTTDHVTGPCYLIHTRQATVLLECGYRHRQEVAEGIKVCFRDAGHILGSAIVELFGPSTVLVIAD